MKDTTMATIDLRSAPRGLAAALWPATLGATAVFGSYGFACVFPFAAVATVAALTLPARRAAALVGAVWLVNQIVGYVFRGYPHEADTVVWGVAIGVGALAALVAARAVLGEARFSLARTLGAFAAAFAAYEALLYALALVDGGLETFSGDIVAKLALSDVLWLAALLALRAVLTRAAPRWFAQAPAARAA